MGSVSDDLTGDGVFGDFMAPTAFVIGVGEAVGAGIATEFVSEDAAETGEFLGAVVVGILMLVFLPVLFVLVALGVGNVILGLFDNL